MTGCVYWITGLSGAGKTTIGKALFGKLRELKPNVVYLDGDKLREVFGNDLGHTREDRFKSAMRNSRLCQMLAEQGLDVICATISLFHDCQEWNRGNIERYREILIEAPMEVLLTRDPKGLYDQARIRGADQPLVGVHIKEEKPLKPDAIVINDGKRSPEEIVSELLATFGLTVPPPSSHG